MGVYSRGAGARVDGLRAGEEWVHHAEGVLAPAEPRAASGLVSGVGGVAAVGAERVDVGGSMSSWLSRGWSMGRVSGVAGCVAAWGRGVWEVGLGEVEVDRAGLFGVHPALLDAALHGIGVGLSGVEGDRERGVVGLPFSWGDVSLFAVGASVLRVCLAPVGGGGVSLVAVMRAVGWSFRWVLWFCGRHRLRSSLRLLVVFGIRCVVLVGCRYRHRRWMGCRYRHRRWMGRRLLLGGWWSVRCLWGLWVGWVTRGLCGCIRISRRSGGR